jgi:parvulin-like peptidyl-prolyl isomerase
MKFNRIWFAIILIALFTLPIFAQEPQLVDETVARVNTDIITRSALIKAKDGYKQELLLKYNNDKTKVEEEFKNNESNILEILIEDKLISQRATELSIDVEAEVNKSFIALAQQANMKLTEFQEYLAQQNIDAEDLRRSFRTDAQRRIILFREVVNPIYEKVTPDEKRLWYQTHSEIFQVPGEVKLSEIFVPLANRSEAEALALAKQIVADARAGKAFNELNKLYSDPARSSTAKGGDLGTFKDNELIESLRKLVEKMNPGDVSDPIRNDKGFQIIRVNEYKKAGSREFTEVEAYITEQIALDKANSQFKEYFKKLKEKAYIRVAENYKSQVSN